jgi:hypothetical protein
MSSQLSTSLTNYRQLQSTINRATTYLLRSTPASLTNDIHLLHANVVTNLNLPLLLIKDSLRS